MGMTKKGKTTCGHYFAGEELKGTNVDGSVMYQTNSKKSKYNHAKVGYSHNSETQIPNYFEARLKTGKKVVVIDCPGFLDTFGCRRVISNAYFNYRVFSKVQKMKFVIVFEVKDI